jgi:1-acyl-sn-glycerol-3-phosphate acyltransferase
VGLRRHIGPIRAFAGLAVALFLVPPWLIMPPRSRLARHLERSFFAIIARGFSLEIACEGRARPHALFVANHISWADIPVLAAVLDADFVAKSDIRDWPVIGWLARRYDPVFVERERRGRSGAHAEAMRARLAKRRSIILCPEGTTSVGTTILPFRTSLFAAADSASVIQPVLVQYLDPDGFALSPERQREVAWIDDDELLGGAVRFARERTRVRLVFLEPIETSAYADRKALALAIHGAMTEAMQRLRSARDSARKSMRPA